MSHVEMVGRHAPAPARRVAILLGLAAVVALVGGVGGGHPGRPAPPPPAPAPLVAGRPGAATPDGGRPPAGASSSVSPRHRLPLVPSSAGAGGG
jgi:hypothetical protein